MAQPETAMEQARRLQMLVNGGIVTVNEAREELGLPALEGIGASGSERARRLQMLVSTGIMSPSEARDQLGLDSGGRGGGVAGQPNLSNG